MKKILTTLTEIGNIKTVISRIANIFPENSFVFSMGLLSLEITFKKESQLLDLLVISSNQNISDIIQTLPITNYNASGNVSLFTIDSIPVNLTHIFCKKVPLSPTAKTIQTILYSQAEKNIISSRGLFVLLSGKFTGKLFNPYRNPAINESKQIEILDTTPEIFLNNPLVIITAIQDCASFGLVLSAELIELIQNNSENISQIPGTVLINFLIQSLQNDKPSETLILLHELGLMKYIFPEIALLAGVEQMKEYNHKDVFYHTCQVVDNISRTTSNYWLRFAALVHDIAKPRTKRFVEGVGWTFHGHEEIGARMMKRIFIRQNFQIEQLDYVRKLVRLHLRPAALANDIVSDSAVRRLITEAGNDLEDLLLLVRADITSKNPTKVAKVLRNYENVEAKIREVIAKDLFAAFQSPVRGDEIMRLCNLKPSKAVGLIKDAIENAILTNEIENTYEAALTYMLKIKDNFLSPPVPVQREQ